MATLTPRFLLRKPAGTDLVNVTTDISNNMDSIDTNLQRATGVRIRRAASQSIPTAVETAITFDTEDFDSDTLFAAPSAAVAVLPTITGLWMVSAHIILSPGIGPSVRGFVSARNNTLYSSLGSVLRNPIGWGDDNASVSGLLYAANGNTLSVTVYQETGAAVNCTAILNTLLVARY